MTTSLEKYLRLPLLQGRTRKHDFNFIVEKLSFKLASWKQKLLNKAGRITLARSVLSSLPTYGMQSLWILQSVCAHIDSSIRRFIWKGIEGKGIHLVKWDTITLPRKMGGPGIRRAREAHTALLGKLVWELLHPSNKLWTQIYRSKYIGEYGNMLQLSSAANSSYCWRSVVKSAQAIKDGFSWRIGDGSHVSFYFDKWLIDGPICDLVPVISEEIKVLKVSDLIVFGSWNFELLGDNFPLEIKEKIQSYPLILFESIQDEVVWGEETNGSFSASSCYNWLTTKERSASLGVSWNWVWKLKIPEKIKVLIWLLRHNSAPVNSFRHFRHLASSNACTRFGGELEESVLHCFRDCTISKQVWISLGFGSTSIDFWNQDLESWLQQNLVAHSPNSVAVSLFARTIWWLWLARNEEVLGQSKPNALSLRLESNLWFLLAMLSFCSQIRLCQRGSLGFLVYSRDGFDQS